MSDYYYFFIRKSSHLVQWHKLYEEINSLYHIVL